MAVLVVVLGVAVLARKAYRAATDDGSATYLESLRKEHTATALVNYVRFNTTIGTEATRRTAIRPALRDLQAETRAHLVAMAVPHPDGLNALFSDLLKASDNRVRVVMLAPPAVDQPSFDATRARYTTPEVTVGDLDVHEALGACASGLTKAFAEATGRDTIAFDSDGIAPTAQLAFTVQASGTGYTTQNGRRIYPGIHLSGALAIVGASGTIAKLPIAVDPPSNLEFSTDALAGMSAGGNDSSVGYALVEGACKTLGIQLVTQLTGWMPTAATPEGDGPDDLATACETTPASDVCLRAGIAVRDGTDPGTHAGAAPARAEHLFELGCDASGIESAVNCIAEADAILARGANTPEAPPALLAQLGVKARFVLERACNANAAAACEHRAAITADYDAEHAIDWLARACDLGSSAACDNPALHQHPTTIQGVLLDRDRVFAVHWADWLKEFDQGHAVYWVASTRSADAVRARLGDAVEHGIARVYAPDALPYGVTAPAGTTTVWAIFATSAGMLAKDATGCAECTGDAPSDFYVGSCMCLPLKAVAR